MNKPRILTATAALALAATANAGPIFSDSFDLENSGAGALNYNALNNWSVTRGTIDVIGHGYFDFVPSQGLYLDLDGSSGQAARIESSSILFTPGSYLLSFALAGNQRGGSDSVTVSLLGYTETFNLNASDPFQTFTREVNVASNTNASIVFDHAEGDNVGILLDDVSVSSVPAPTGCLLAAGAGSWVLRRRRR